MIGRLLPILIFVLLGILLAGPLVCGASQIVNDWFDRHVDAINEPQRPIPSSSSGTRWAGSWHAWPPARCHSTAVY